MASDVVDRARGTLLGVHAGDALGAAVEFRSPEQISAQFPHGLRDIVGGGVLDWPAGHATDDTDLTRAVLLAYLARCDDPGVDVVRAAADRMTDWFNGDWPGRTPGSTPRDVGGATRQGLHRYAETGDPRRAGAGADSAGNGSLMRCTPTALAVRDREQRIHESIEISAITHDDPRCTTSCAAYNEIVAALVHGAGPGDAVVMGLEASSRLGRHDVTEAITYGQVLHLAGAAATGQAFLPNDGRGFVLDSLTTPTPTPLSPAGCWERGTEPAHSRTAGSVCSSSAPNSGPRPTGSSPAD